MKMILFLLFLALITWDSPAAYAWGDQPPPASEKEKDSGKTEDGKIKGDSDLVKEEAASKAQGVYKGGTAEILSPEDGIVIEGDLEIKIQFHPPFLKGLITVAPEGGAEEKEYLDGPVTGAAPILKTYKRNTPVLYPNGKIKIRAEGWSLPQTEGEKQQVFTEEVTITLNNTGDFEILSPTTGGPHTGDIVFNIKLTPSVRNLDILQDEMVYANSQFHWESNPPPYLQYILKPGKTWDIQEVHNFKYQARSSGIIALQEGWLLKPEPPLEIQWTGSEEGYGFEVVSPKEGDTVSGEIPIQFDFKSKENALFKLILACSGSTIEKSFGMSPNQKLEPIPDNISFDTTKCDPLNPNSAETLAEAWGFANLLYYIQTAPGKYTAKVNFQQPIHFQINNIPDVKLLNTNPPEFGTLSGKQIIEVQTTPGTSKVQILSLGGQGIMMGESTAENSGLFKVEADTTSVLYDGEQQFQLRLYYKSPQTNEDTEYVPARTIRTWNIQNSWLKFANLSQGQVVEGLVQIFFDRGTTLANQGTLILKDGDQSTELSQFSFSDLEFVEWDTTVLKNKGHLLAALYSSTMGEKNEWLLGQKITVTVRNFDFEIVSPASGSSVKGKVPLALALSQTVHKLGIQFGKESEQIHTDFSPPLQKGGLFIPKELMKKEEGRESKIKPATQGDTKKTYIVEWDTLPHPDGEITVSIRSYSLKDQVAFEKTLSLKIENTSFEERPEKEFEVEVFNVRVNGKSVEAWEGERILLSPQDLKDGAIEITGDEKSSRQLEKLEISLDGGAAWHRVEMRNSWFFKFKPRSGEDYNVRFRATAKDGKQKTLASERFKFGYSDESRAEASDPWAVLQEMARAYEAEDFRGFMSFVSEEFPNRGELEEFIRRDFRDYDGIKLNLFQGRIVDHSLGKSVEADWELRYFTTAASRKIRITGSTLQFVFEEGREGFKLLEMRGANPLFGARSPEIAVASGVPSEVGRTLQKIEDEGRRAAKQAALVLVSDETEASQEDIPVTLEIVRAQAFYQDGGMEEVDFDAIQTDRPIKPQASVRIIDNPKKIDFNGIKLEVLDSLSGNVGTVTGIVEASQTIVFRTDQNFTFPAAMSGRSGTMTFTLDPENKFTVIDESLKTTRERYSVV